jgi:hypothetical protein
MNLTIEGDPSSPLNKWPLLIDTETIKSIGIAWLFKENGTWNFLPRVTGNVALFYNAQFFLRLSLPFGVFFGLRLGPIYLFQCGIGWKLNGRFAILFRLQTDASAAAGVSGPNYGQSTGYSYGTH